MIIGLPRSRTTWLANLFTTGNSICLHDPLLNHSFHELDTLYPGKYVGISDTSLCLAGYRALNEMPYRKVIIHRELSDVRRSLGLPAESISLYGVYGLHVKFNEIDERIREIWEYCLDIPFDQDRYDLLKDFNVQPHFEGMTPPNQEKIAEFVALIKKPT